MWDEHRNNSVSHLYIRFAFIPEDVPEAAWAFAALVCLPSLHRQQITFMAAQALAMVHLFTPALREMWVQGVLEAWDYPVETWGEGGPVSPFEL